MDATPLTLEMSFAYESQLKHSKEAILASWLILELPIGGRL